MAQGCAWSRNLDPNFCPGWGLNLVLYDPRGAHGSEISIQISALAKV